ncbi:hypothetical protein BDV32DRAFT_80753 [Aspergillus pseudonomiae]|uniref:Uncharacterized protein n=1 Tax=Aspergillus pseudonomiae TaxID=1506151 RepID=A0A5N7D917_9EURO|nr:uncharacterized protein BDV37DRAFT_251545 [Aspergillus pseudonomiae]KAB8257612.1 hypothetical protein BDV32DRAFT_80753 [Aspergillus pseudonomiae]KAE8402921.1 hypothetical protein BDV37DRAFT_251545 [Aspergillus pseudonomiae]
MHKSSPLYAVASYILLCDLYFDQAGAQNGERYIPGIDDLSSHPEMRIPTPKVVGMNWSIGFMPRSLGRCPHHIGVYEIHMLGGVQVVEPLKTSTTSINKANGIFNLSPSNAFMVEEKYQPLPEINIDLFTDLVEVLTLAGDAANRFPIVMF